MSRSEYARRKANFIAQLLDRPAPGDFPDLDEIDYAELKEIAEGPPDPATEESTGQ